MDYKNNIILYLAFSWVVFNFLGMEMRHVFPSDMFSFDYEETILLCLHVFSLFFCLCYVGIKKIKLFLLIVLLAICMITVVLTGCDTEASRGSYNLSQQADNFNIVRQLTVINCIEGDVLFQMTGKLSITADTVDNQLEIIVEDNGTYVKHFVGLSDNVTYVVEDLNLGANDVAKYRYTLNFNPNMWIPVNVETID